MTYTRSLRGGLWPSLRESKARNQKLESQSISSHVCHSTCARDFLFREAVKIAIPKRTKREIRPRPLPFTPSPPAAHQNPEATMQQVGSVGGGETEGVGPESGRASGCEGI